MNDGNCDSPLEIADRTQKLMDNGELLECLTELAWALERWSGDERLLSIAANVWVAAIDKPDILLQWPEEQRHLLQRILILQEKCSISPPIFHHRIAAQHSGGVANHLDLAAQMLEPTLEQLFQEPKVNNNSILMALLLRSKLKKIDQQTLSALHHAYFHEFAEDDLPIPYSSIFDPHNFKMNIDDLEKYVGTQSDKLVDGSIPLTHLVFLYWVVPQAFRDLDRDFAAKGIEVRTSLCNLTANEKSAGCSLALRFLNYDDQSESLRSIFGDASVSSQLFNNLKHSRNRLTDEAAGGLTKATKRLSSLPNQLASAAWNFASATVPSFSLIGRKPRVAVCVSGQLRGYRSTFPSWRSLLANTEATIFVDTWKKIGRGTPEPYRFVLPFEGDHFVREYKNVGTDLGMEQLRQRYPVFFENFEQSGEVSASQLSAFYQTPYVRVDDEKDPLFRDLTNSEKMYFKAERCFEMMQESGKEFDLVIRIRPDKPITAVAFFWADMIASLKTNPALYCETPMGTHYGALLMGDQFALGLPEASSIYAHTYSAAKLLQSVDLYKMNKELTGHSSFAQICWLNGIDVRKVPIKFGAFRETEPMLANDIQKTLEKDSVNRMDSYDRRLIAANAADLSG